MVSIPLLADSDRQDLFSLAYIKAVVSAAGYNFGGQALDRNKTDVFIEHNYQPGFRPVYDRLLIQAKCSFATSPHADGSLHYSLDVPTFNFLRETKITPRLLVLVWVPRPDQSPPIPWVECVDQQTILRYRAYYCSFMGAPPAPTGQSTYTVHLPLTNSFDPCSVHRLMGLIAQGIKTL